MQRARENSRTTGVVIDASYGRCDCMTISLSEASCSCPCQLSFTIRYNTVYVILPGAWQVVAVQENYVRDLLRLLARQVTMTVDVIMTSLFFYRTLHGAAYLIYPTVSFITAASEPATSPRLLITRYHSVATGKVMETV